MRPTVGLTLTASTGTVSGTPTSVGAYLVGVTASQGSATLSHIFEWDVLPLSLDTRI